mgnify:FL=1
MKTGDALKEGKALLKRLIRELPVDVFCTNTMPGRHQSLGVDYETLKGVREDLIWCGISAMGEAYPNVPGYDPVMQAQCGYMDLSGAADGPPMQCGPPLTDLKAGDEAFTQVVLALWERDQFSRGKHIDISMAQVAVSWLHTFLPMLDMGSRPEELRRSGNEHRQFIPVNAYRTDGGYIYLAIGSDVQWQRLVGQQMFASLDLPRYATNEERRNNKRELHRSMETITSKHSTDSVAGALVAAGIPHAPITPVEGVMELPFVADTALRTVTPDGETVRLPPPAQSTEHLEAVGGELPFAPAYGESGPAIMTEIGMDEEEVARLYEQGVLAKS